jgi:hypothetical protein
MIARFFALIHQDVEAVIEKVKTTKSKLVPLKAGIAIFIHQRIGLA